MAKREIDVMYYMIQGTPMNLPFMMLRQIKEATGRSKACVPNGMVFALIFMHVKISLEREDFRELLHRFLHGAITPLHRAPQIGWAMGAQRLATRTNWRR